LSPLSSTSSADFIVGESFIDVFADWSNLTRAAPGRKLLPIPGTTPGTFLWPINFISRSTSTTTNDDEDGPRGEVRGFSFLTATDSAGAKIVNHSEDFITIGTVRHRVFHNHVHNERYQFIAIEEDV
jgi:hypothetical protein